MDDKVFLSVIIPSYNSLKTIRNSVSSVVSEIMECRTAHPELFPSDGTAEIIIVDDGSTDESPALADGLSGNVETVFGEGTSFIEIKVIHKKNGGVASARNEGLRVARGEFIAFNDSDDMWLEGSLACRLSILEENPDSVLVTGNHGSDSQIILGLDPVYSKDGNLYYVRIENELFKNYYTVQNSLVKKEALDGVFFKEGMRYAEEIYFFCQIAVKFRCLFVNKRLSQSIVDKERYGDSGLSGNLFRMELGELKSLGLVRKELGLPFFLWAKASAFSILKYFRRVLICMLRRR